MERYTLNLFCRAATAAVHPLPRGRGEKTAQFLATLRSPLASAFRLRSIAIAFTLLAAYSALAADDPEIVARDAEGHGLLCKTQNKSILFVSGTPEQMGAAHGRLINARVEKTMAIYYYLVGGAFSVAKDKWFITHLEEIEGRVRPHIPERFLTECDALARTSGVPAKTLRLANLIPEQFHCSGVAVRGKAAKGGQVLHARVLDYMVEVGLQKQALLIVYQPEGRHAWVNVGYCGFIGTVTAMNVKGLAIGEMGGEGQGQWDGTPMTYLLRDIIETAATVDDAIEMFKKAKRTCEYFYVLSDKAGNLASLRCTPTEVLVLKPGEQHPLLPTVPDDTVLVSAGDRAKALSSRLQEKYGQIGIQEMIELVKRPVAMKSNLHTAIFAPQTQDLWFADARKQSPACDEPYAHVNLNALLEFYQRSLKPAADTARK